MEHIVGGNGGDWLIGADDSYLVMRCPVCFETLEQERYATYFLSQLLDQIGEHQEKKHSQEG